MATLEQLEAIAKAATPGPWIVDHVDVTDRLIITDEQSGYVADIATDEDESLPDAKFITAFHPARALRLLALVQEAKLAVQSLKGLLECDEFGQNEQGGIERCAKWLADLAAFEKED